MTAHQFYRPNQTRYIGLGSGKGLGVTRVHELLSTKILPKTGVVRSTEPLKGGLGRSRFWSF